MNTHTIDQLFRRKKTQILSIYFTAGYPSKTDTNTILKGLIDAGVDMIEIGIPYSDPLADGETIQHSSQQALNNGMSIDFLFEQLDEVTEIVARLPVLLMSYFNPILQYGVKRFCQKANALNIAGVIIPDLPLYEYVREYKSIFDTYQLKNIFLISPQTSQERINEIVKEASGFLYVVSSSNITGAKSTINQKQIQYFQEIMEMKLPIPKLIGFGISNNDTFSTACKFANGAIVGSAFIKHLENCVVNIDHIQTFIDSIRCKGKM